MKGDILKQAAIHLLEQNKNEAEKIIQNEYPFVHLPREKRTYTDSVILIYRGYCYVFTENNGLKTVYKNDKVRA